MVHSAAGYARALPPKPADRPHRWWPPCCSRLWLRGAANPARGGTWPGHHGVSSAARESS